MALSDDDKEPSNLDTFEVLWARGRCGQVDGFLFRNESLLTPTGFYLIICLGAYWSRASIFLPMLEDPITITSEGALR
jgi:hypothetical protein